MARPRPAKSVRPAWRGGWIATRTAALSASLLAGCLSAWAQAPITSTAAPVNPATPAAAAEAAHRAPSAGVRNGPGLAGARSSDKLGWSRLSATQKTALAPLAGLWGELSEPQKLKWMSLSRHFAGLAPSEQERLHSRMSEWASLSMQQRAQARISFAEASALPPAEKKARWEAYQSLSPEERRRLAEESRARPRGAAPAVRPLVRARPVALPAAATPHEHEPASAKARLHGARINHNTLLPQRQPPRETVAPAVRQAEGSAAANNPATPQSASAGDLPQR